MPISANPSPANTVTNGDKDKPSSVSGSSTPSADKPASSTDTSPKVSKREQRKADRAADREQRKADRAAKRDARKAGASS